MNSASTSTPSATAPVSIQASKAQELKSTTPSTQVVPQLTTSDISAAAVTVFGSVESGLVEEIDHYEYGSRLGWSDLVFSSRKFMVKTLGYGVVAKTLRGTRMGWR